jgi:hypothetical protein
MMADMKPGPDPKRDGRSPLPACEGNSPMTDIRRWEAMVLTQPGAPERVADIEMELRHAVLGGAVASCAADPAQAREGVNSEDV